MDVSNDKEIERLGANATATFALEFWEKLSDAARKDGLRLDSVWEDQSSTLSLSPSTDPNSADAFYTAQLVLTKSHEEDTRLYRRFRSNFATMPVHNVGGSGNTHDLLSGSRWASLLLASEGLIGDFNFMTLLREDAHDMFWMTAAEVCDGLAVVPRSQFLYVEVARCAEKVYDGRFRRKLQLWDTKTQTERLQEALTKHEEENILKALHLLRTQWPYPRRRVFAETGVLKVVKSCWLSDDKRISQAVRTDCLNLLQYWQDMVDLGNLSSHNTWLSNRQQKAVTEAGRALAFSSFRASRQSAGITTKRLPPTTQTTSSLQDVILSNTQDVKSSRRLFQNYGMLVVEDFIQGEALQDCQQQAQSALDALIKEQLRPRGLQVDGMNEFDFAEVRQRPGHRVDNRYKILDDPDSPIALLSDQLLEILPKLLTDEDGVEYKILHGGVVHSFPREQEEHPIPHAQLWHRDAPSLFMNAHHETHCFNVFIPLVDVTATNGTTEFIPGSHDDERFEEVVTEVFRLAQTDSGSQHELAVRAEVGAGSLIVFDVRLLHRGLSNASMQERPMLYFTMSREWYTEKHMFDETSIVKDRTASNGNALMTKRLFQLVSGMEPPLETEIGHPHYTSRFDLLLMQLKNDNIRQSNMNAVLTFCTLPEESKRNVVRTVIDSLQSRSAQEEKQATLKEARQKRRAIREEEASVYLHHRDLNVEEDFASITTDMSDVGALYRLTCNILFEESELIGSLGFVRDQDGLLILLAMLKSYCLSYSSGYPKTSASDLEEAFTSWWHAGVDRFALTPCAATNGDGNRAILVVFSSLGSGIARPEWAGSLRNVASRLSVLNVLDPAFSWYCQDPSCQWMGGDFYEKELKRRTQGYEKVMLLGDSMGGAAALRFSRVADKVLSFTPQVDIRSYEAITRADFAQETRVSFQDSLIQAVNDTKADITIHYGRQCHEDVRQVGLLPSRPNVDLVSHEFDDHILSLHLRDEGKLEGIVEAAVNQFL